MPTLMLILLLWPPPWSVVLAMTTAAVHRDGDVGGSGPARAMSTIVDETRRPPAFGSGQKSKRYYCGDHNDDEALHDGRDVYCSTDSYRVAETIAQTGTAQTTTENDHGPQDVYYDESGEDNSFINISWECYLPLMFMGLLWIIGPLLCLLLSDSEENHELKKIILKNSQCHYPAKYTNR